jgi:hypothetical protein
MASDVEHRDLPARTREEIVRARQRRQTRTFAGIFAGVALVGFIAFGNWQQWWTIGGSSSTVAVACPVQVMTKPELANITVINGTDRGGLAGAVSKELKKRRFTVLSVETEEQDKPINGVVEIRYGADGKLAARTVAAQFPAKVVMVDDQRDTEAVDVIIGTKYKSMIAAKKAAAAIQLKPEPDNCVPVAVSSPPVTSAG